MCSASPVPGTATSRPSRLPPAGDPGDATVSDMLDWQATGGFSVDASVRIKGDDRAGVEP
jgi:hypothetical protein